jgi:hypothetical protein
MEDIALPIAAGMLLLGVPWCVVYAACFGFSIFESAIDVRD